MITSIKSTNIDGNRIKNTEPNISPVRQMMFRNGVCLSLCGREMKRMAMRKQLFLNISWANDSVQISKIGILTTDDWHFHFIIHSARISECQTAAMQFPNILQWSKDNVYKCTHWRHTGEHTHTHINTHRISATEWKKRAHWLAGMFNISAFSLEYHSSALQQKWFSVAHCPICLFYGWSFFYFSSSTETIRWLHPSNGLISFCIPQYTFSMAKGMPFLSSIQ